MTLAFEHFRSYYTKLYDNKILTLVPDQGTGDLKYYGYNGDGKKKYTVSTNTTKMVILLLFNQKTVWKLTDMMNALPGLPERELKDALGGICNHPKNKFLILQNDDEPKTSQKSSSSSSKPNERCTILRTVENSKISVLLNDKFFSKTMKINLVAGNRSVRIDDAHSKSVKNTIEEDRKHEIDSAIVRIMKSRKKLAHNNLITEIVSQLKSRFQPQPPTIKQRIESLIDREYLKRSNGNMQLYEYMA